MKPLTFNLDISKINVKLDDPRLGLPSASLAPILVHCPGAWRMSMGRPDIGRFQQDATRGQRIHALLALSPFARPEGILGNPVTDEEWRDAYALALQADELRDKWLADNNLIVARIAMSEERLYLRQGLTPISSGQNDRVYEAGPLPGLRALVLDFKTGWQDLGTTEENEQLLVYALLTAFNFPGYDEISVGFVRDVGRPFYYTYTEEKIQSAKMLWEATLREAFRQDAPLMAGAWCQFCKAQTVCPARREKLVQFRTDARTLSQSWETLEPAVKLALFTAAKEAVSLSKAITEKCREDLEANASAIPGLEFGTGKRDTSITDADKAFELATKAGLSRDEFMSCGKPSFAQIRDAIGAKRGWNKKDYDTEARKLLGGVIETTVAKPPIEIL